MNKHPKTSRYHGLVIALHWIMALAFIVMLSSGLSMSNLDFENKQLQYKLYQWHKSGGVLLLIAFFARVALRFTLPRPPLPETIKKNERSAAKFGHFVLYIMMILMPLTGWIMVSSSAYGLPTIVFGWFEWPHIPGLELNKDVNALSKTTHYYLALGFIALIIVHIMAVVKHYKKDGVNLIKRMTLSRNA